MATIRQVSERAGVSVATVSRAFSAPEKLSESTLVKVRDAAEALNYKPNSLAQIFRSNKTNSVVVMVPDLSNAFFSRVLSGIERVAKPAGYSLLLSDTRDDRAIEKSCIDLYDSKRVDGVIQLGASSAEDLCGNRDVSNLPFIHAIESAIDTECPTVAIDNIAASQAIADHLVQLGHRAFAVIAGPAESAITRYRLAGVQRALEAAGLELCADSIVHEEFSMSGGFKAAQVLHRRALSFTAFVCMSDELAIGAMKHLHASQVRIPEDVSVVGFDNIVFSEFCEPALTTVTQPAESIGALSMEILVGLMRGEQPLEVKNVLDTDFVVRDSTSSVRSGVM